MRSNHAHIPRGVSGQAGVEAVVLLPVCAIVLAVLAQLALVAISALAVERAAVEGARAAERGAPVGSAVRAALPAGFRDRLVVGSVDGAVHVSLATRSLVPFLPVITVAASAS